MGNSNGIGRIVVNTLGSVGRRLGLAPLVLVNLTLVGSLFAGCDDEPGTTETETGQDNGARCVLSPAGANICRGDLCVGLATGGTTIGACSESCNETCRFGGECIERPGASRVCAVPCTSSDDCTDGFNCQPITGAQVCTTGDCVNPLDNLYCVPPA